MSKKDTDILLNTISKDKWKRIGTQKRAGVLVPLFSVYSKKSSGIGDLEDLKILIDFCEKSGNSILQLLPMNEVGSTFCPYDAISSFALEPAYISLEALPASRDKDIKKRIAALKKAFPAGSPHVDYRIKAEKMKILWQMYEGQGTRDKGQEEEFEKFGRENNYWLDDFALFNIIKHHQKGKPWYEWEDVYKDRAPEALKAFEKEYKKELTFQRWVQWIAAKQFKAAKDYAGKKKILIKGDLPILISRDSADVWAHPSFFRLEFAAGAPPDMYCAKGQRWGMPTYNWENIASDGYRYLKEKLKYAENFYDILRVDHVVGLFRIWSIPYGDSQENMGLNGLFDPADENRWEAHGKTLLYEMLSSTNMLLCAEDLGIIPKTCPQTLEEYGIPGNSVQRWTKDWQVKHDFLPPQDYRALSVAMLSTHDTTNWAAWWEDEAGTIDEALFIRKAHDRGIDYESAKPKLFNPKFSKHGRLRWQDSIDSVEKLVEILGKRSEDVRDFIEMYENTYKEKERLWKQIGLKGEMREKCDVEIVRAVLKITLGSAAIFCIELLNDYLSMADIFKGDPYQYRVNTPGTVNKNNWSLVIPISLEELVNHKVCKEIKSMVNASGRI